MVPTPWRDRFYTHRFGDDRSGARDRAEVSSRSKGGFLKQRISWEPARSAGLHECTTSRKEAFAGFGPSETRSTDRKFRPRDAPHSLGSATY
jgi:hypothetical protein